MTPQTFTVASRSTPGTTYTVTHDRFGWHCQCLGYQHGVICAHIRSVQPKPPVRVCPTCAVALQRLETLVLEPTLSNRRGGRPGERRVLAVVYACPACDHAEGTAL